MTHVPFVNHHVHSYFSVLDGMPSPDEIAQRVAEMGQTSFSLTDHGTLSGIPEAYRAAKKYGLGFTPGIEFYYALDRKAKHKDRYGKVDYHLILLATSNDGYHNLLKINTPAWTEGFYKHPRVDYDLLSQYSGDIVATTSCLGGIVNQFLMRNDFDGALEELGKMIDIFGKENVYIEMQNSGEEEKKLVIPGQLELHKKTGVPLIATADSHYAHKCDHDYHDTLICTSIGDKKYASNRKSLTFNGHYHLHSGEEMLKLFPEDEFPGAVSNTVELAERTNFTMKIDDDLEYIMPKIDVDEGKTESETLREHVYQGAADPKRYGDAQGNIPDHVKERIDYELGVVENMGFSGYFLIVENIVKLFAKNGIFVGPGRGCLHGDTLVQTSTGFKKISDIQEGDKVITIHGEYGTVGKVHKYATDPEENFVRILTHKGNVLRLTEKHKVYVETAGKYGDSVSEFVKAGDLQKEDIIKSVGYLGHEEYDIVHSVELSDPPPFVYDLSIMDSHPSFLTEAGSVHNSAPGSVSVYCLGITNVDPLANDLHFERFLNPDRISMPDIDIDVPRTKRAQALRLIEEEYGEGHVASISNHGKFKMKESLRRVSKVFGNSPTIAQKISDVVSEYCESQVPPESLTSISESGKVPDEIRRKLSGAEHIEDIIEHASKIEGRMFSNGVHACGIVITTGKIDDYFPIRMSKKTILPVCQFDGDDTSALGGVKMDILGLINLDECEEAEKNIKLDLGEDVDSSCIPLDDNSVFDMLSHGDGGGVFQLGCLAGDTIIDGDKDLTIEKLYLLRNSGSKKDRIRSLFLGQGVIDYNDIKTVVFSGKKELYTMEAVLPNDETISIKATLDHKFFTKEGWKELRDISVHDEVLGVSQKDISVEFIPDSVRGEEDIFDMFLQMNPDYRRIPQSQKFAVDLGDINVYPQFIHSEFSGSVVCLIPEKNTRYIHMCRDAISKLKDNDERKIVVKSYSDVVEEYLSDPPMDCKILLPLGTDMAKVVSIKKHGVEKTYDISMNESAQSFIANDFIVHNSSGMRVLLKNMKPDSFPHISAALALFRPGPMGDNTHNEFCVRKNNPDADREYLHEDMEEILEETAGLTVFQEDIMSLARHFADYTGAEADELRKAVAKKIPEKMEIQKNKLIPAINSRYGDNLGQKLWDIIEPFGAYAFCKAHSTAYAVLSYRTAYLKAHYRPQFAGAVIDQEAIDKGAKEIVKAMTWIREGGVIVENPDINKSGKRTVTSKDSITLPLRIVSSIGDNMASSIVDEREQNGEFQSVVDFVSRCSINKSSIINLAKAGAFDSLGVSRAAVVSHAEDILSLAKTQKSSEKVSDGLFGDLIDLSESSDSLDLETEPKTVFINNEDCIVDEDLYGAWERQSMGVILGPHPYSTIRDLNSAKKLLEHYPPVDSFHSPREQCMFSGVITNITNKVSSRGKQFSLFDIETDLGIVPAVAFSHIPVESVENSLVIMEGGIEDDSFGNDDDSGESFTPKAIVFSMKKIDLNKLKSDN